MISWLRHNFGYKLLALVFACLLHFYVAGLINARPAHLLTLPITVRNLPPSLILDDSTLPSVTLTLDGPPEDISRLTDTSVTAWVDLSHARAGQTRALPVHLSGVPPTITVDSDPQPVTLNVQQRRRRQMAVSADDIGVAPSGYSFAPPNVSPREAVITGTRAAVSAVARLVAQADPDQQPGAVDEDFPIIALDATGIPVSNVTVSPPTAHVRLDLTRALARKTLLVSANIVGTLPASYRFGSIEVAPAAVEAEGKPDTLAAVNTLTTQPIDVSGATKDLVRRVAPIIPPGLTLSPRSPITVTIHIIAPPAAPPPAVAPDAPEKATP